MLSGAEETQSVTACIKKKKKKQTGKSQNEGWVVRAEIGFLSLFL